MKSWGNNKTNPDCGIFYKTTGLDSANIFRGEMPWCLKLILNDAGGKKYTCVYWDRYREGGREEERDRESKYGKKLVTGESM